MRSTWTLCGVWLAAMLPASAGPRVPAELFTWLSARAAEVRSLAAPDAVDRARAASAELEQRLGEAGFDPALARALAATAPVERFGEPAGDVDVAAGRPEAGAARADDASAAAAGLDRVARRLTRFDRACAVPQLQSPAGARSELEEILADPIYGNTPPLAGPLRRIGFEVRRRLGRIFGAVGRFAAANGRLLAVALLVLLLASAVLVLARIRWTGSRRRRADPAVAAASERLAPERTAAEGLIELARREAGAGRGRRAVRLLMQAAVLAFRLRGLLPAEPGLTDLEGLERLEPVTDAATRSAFGDLVNLHDRGVYGGAGTSRESVDRALALTERLVAIPAGEGAR